MAKNKKYKTVTNKQINTVYELMKTNNYSYNLDSKDDSIGYLKISEVFENQIEIPSEAFERAYVMLLISEQKESSLKNILEIKRKLLNI